MGCVQSRDGSWQYPTIFDGPPDRIAKPGEKPESAVDFVDKLLDQIEGRLGPLEDRLGLSPEARLRLGISSVEHKSKLEAFLAKQGGTQ